MTLAVQFTKAANGELTCNVNGIRLHSAYNPSHEASQFVLSLSCAFNPKFILITEPCLSYCVNALRKSYPQTVLCAVRYTNDFSMTDALWDKVFFCTGEQASVSLSEQLFSYLGDEGIVSCLFASWKPSESAFASQYDFCWQQIRAAVIKSKNVLTTRSYFAKRWSKNALRNCLFIKNIVKVHSGTSPVILCASGTSLTSSLPFIKANQNRCSIICVSSALAPLVANNITPDLCISTDGGYWAKKHLSFAVDAVPDMVIAISPESAVSSSVLQSHPILPLLYGDGIGDDLFNAMNIKGMRAMRNGTVSGTAVELALALTTGPLFFCGLDLAPSKNFSHVKPNELENTDAPFDYRCSTTDTRLTPSSFRSPSLEIYHSWFASASFDSRVFRLSDNWKYSNTLGEIKECNWHDFDLRSNTFAASKFYFEKEHDCQRYACTQDDLLSLISKNNLNGEWIKSAVPAEAIIYERSKGTQQESSALKNVIKGMSVFYKDILRAIGKEGCL